MSIIAAMTLSSSFAFTHRKCFFRGRVARYHIGPTMLTLTLFTTCMNSIWDVMHEITKTQIPANKKGAERTLIIEGYIMFHAQRILNGYRDAIKEGRAPEWVNDISYYDVTVPTSFANDFREYRNKVCGHVAYERSSQLSLSQFYKKYHKFLYLLYSDAMRWWGSKGEAFPDLKEITDFTVMLEEERMQ